MHLYICALLYKCIIIQLHIIQFVWKIKVQKVEKGWNLPLGWDVCRASLKRRCRFLEVPFRPCFYIQEHKPKYHNRKSFQNWTNQITEFRATETKKLSATFKSQNLIKFIVTVRSKLRSHVSWWITWLFLSIFLGEKSTFFLSPSSHLASIDEMTLHEDLRDPTTFLYATERRFLSSLVNSKLVIL